MGKNDPVVGASEVRRLEERVRDLKRLLVRKTMEVEILKGPQGLWLRWGRVSPTDMAKAGAKEQTWLPPSLPQDRSR